MREFLDEIKGERQQLDRQRRERKEREAVLQLRRELLNYNFHECPRIKKEAFKDLEVDDTDLIRIALIGPTGSGKTSLVGKSACFYLFFFFFFITLCLYSIAPGACERRRISGCIFDVAGLHCLEMKNRNRNHSIN